MLASRRADSAAADLAEGYPRARIRDFRADLTEDSLLEEWIACVRASLDRLDVLVHSAGTISLGDVESMGVEDLDRLYRLNLRVPVRLTQALLPLLRAARGQIVFINSTAADKPGELNAHYAAMKAALRVFADAVRDHVNRDGIRVMSVYPGRTATAMQAEVLRREGRGYDSRKLLQPSEVAAVIMRALLTPASVEVTEIRVRPVQKL
jgi:NADP-dependent 3-hydroxy acid dehydrogenase YdfG